MRISAKVEYAVLAMVELARGGEALAKAASLAEATGVPGKFLEAILADLKRDGLVTGLRGPEGGHRLAQPAAAITVADIIRAVEGPLAEVHGERPEQSDERLREVWVAVRVALRTVLERVTLADLVADELPEDVRALLAREDAWISR